MNHPLLSTWPAVRLIRPSTPGVYPRVPSGSADTYIAILLLVMASSSPLDLDTLDAAISSSRLDVPLPLGLRERRPSANLNLARASFSPFTSIDKEKDPVPPNQPHDLDSAPLEQETTALPPPAIIHTPLDKSVTFAPQPSIPSTPHGGATPGTLTPTLTRTTYFDGQEPLVAHRKAERYKFRLAAAFVAFFSCGWADGTPGTIIPHLEEALHLSHFTVSMLFIAGAFGFGVGTFIVEPLMFTLGKFSANATQRTFLPKLFTRNVTQAGSDGEAARGPIIGHSISQGRLLTVLVGCVFQIMHYTIAVLNPPFWALCIAFSFGGVAISIFSGQMNAYVAGASVRTQGRALGTLHGFYGIGAFASPLVCQTLLARGWSWHRFYWTSFGLALLNLCVMVAAFHTTRGEFEYEKQKALELAMQNELDRQAEAEVANDGLEMHVLGTQSSRPRSTGNNGMPKSTMRAALSLPYVWLFMAFLGFYTGSETTTGGWIVTYLLRQRNADPNTVGYVASGFWGGLALGRIVLGHASPYIGMRKEKHLVHAYIAVSLIMSLLIWFVPSFIGNAVFAAVIGLCLGPIFPTSLALATKLLPKEVHLTALAAMSSVASIGSAIFPFFAGILANSKGVAYVQPFMCAILGVMGTLWCFFPSRVGMTV